MIDEKLSSFLDRTGQFHRTVIGHVAGLGSLTSRRFVASFRAGRLSIEHAIGAHLLISHGLYATGYALFRLQYECLVRGIWLLHAANDEWVIKLSEPLTEESAKRANEGVMLAQMLKQLDTSEAPEHIVADLKLFRDVTWKALNSYAHGGLHPLARAAAGYPPQLTIDALRNSNAIVALAAQLNSLLSGDLNNMDPVHKMHVEFADCIPITKRPQNPTK